MQLNESTGTWNCTLEASGDDKSRSLSNVSGMVGSSLRLAPMASPHFETYETPGPLRRCRSPIPSIL